MARVHTPAIGRLFSNRLLDALAKSYLCFAVLHDLALIAYVSTSHDFAALNVFSIIGVTLIFPGLGNGARSHWLSVIFALALYALVWRFLTSSSDRVSFKGRES